jgi:hypothetical protein
MPYGLSIDLDAIKCVDMGHHWIETFYGRCPSGKLKGTPIRAAVCKTCNSAKIDHLSWSGKVTSTTRDNDEVYITNARLLGDHHQRRMQLRMAKNERMKKVGDIGSLMGEEAD